MSFERESRSAKVFRAVHTQYNTCKILVLSKVGFLTLLYGLQSSSANRWWILASVKSFLEGLYSNSWRSIFQPASSWLQLGLEGERMRLHFYDGLPLEDRYSVLSRRVRCSIEIQCRLIFGYASWPVCI